MSRGSNFFVCVLLCAFSICFADDYYWIDSDGGEMGDPTKWDSSAAPGEDDYVYFTLPNAYTVWLDDSYTHDRLHVEGSDLTLDLNGNNYYLDGTADYNRAAIIGDTVDSSLTVFGGGIYSGDLFLGRGDSQATGRLNLSGAETFWIGHINNDYHGFYYGDQGNAEVSISDGAYLEHGHGSSGIYRSALITLDGENTKWYVDGYFGMSIYGNTKVNQTNDAYVQFGYLEMAEFMHSSAEINVAGIRHHTTELAITNDWWDPISLSIGMGGKAAINLTRSKLYHTGHTAIALKPGSRGELNIYNGSWADLQGNVAVGGTLDNPGGKGLIYSGGDLHAANQNEGEFVVVWPNGSIQADGGEIVLEYSAGSANPIILKGGTLEGWGWIAADVQNESGIVMPGVTGEWLSLGIKYDYQQGPDGTLKIGIGGPFSAYRYSVLKAHGQATLDGFLDVDLLDGYVPGYNEVFTIIEAPSISGQFVNAPSQVIFEGGTFDISYGETEVILTHFRQEPSCPAYPLADFNRDCLVDLSDLAVMAGQWLRCGYEPDSACP